jgi:sirohydrochlorin ferrochelatase
MAGASDAAHLYRAVTTADPEGDVSAEPHLLIAAHGTQSAAGSATTAALVAAIAAARPNVSISLCFLDVATPSLRQALDATSGPVVVVPLLLSTGYHVQTDIPAIAAGRPEVRVARHLGPDPLVISALVDRLGPAPATSTVLIGIGSSRAAARADFDVAAGLLSSRLGRAVSVVTMAEDVRAALSALPPPVQVATYLLAEGRFLDSLRRSAEGIATVAEPIGVHPNLVSLVLARYDQAAPR